MKQEKNAKRKIDEEQLRLLYANLPLGLLATLVNAIVVAIIFSDVIERDVIEGWILTMMTVMAIRYVVYINYINFVNSKKKVKSENLYKKWEIYFAIGLFATALVWAVAVQLFFMKSALSDQLLLAFVLAGMVAGAMSVSAYRFYLYSIYSVPILGILMVYVFISGNYYLGGMIILYMMITLGNAKRMADNSTKVQMLQQNNEKLIARLVEEKNSVKVALAEATSANGMKDLFIGNISHEFRTPLNAIQGFSQVLQHRSDTPENIKDLVKKINASGNQLLVLVDVLMKYSEYKSGTLAYIPTQGSVTEIISSLISEERVRVLEKDLKFEIDIPENIIIEADFIMLKFVLNILIEDAVENASKESVITISAMSSSNNYHYKIKICNDCPILLSEEAENIFDPFTQMEESHESRNLARGLGLYVAKGMTEDYHQGSLRLKLNQPFGYCMVMGIPKKSLQKRINI